MSFLPHTLFLLLATALFSSAAEPAPGDRLAKRAEALLASMKVTDYQATTEIDEASGSIRCDCSGLVGYLLRQDFLWAYKSLEGNEAPWRVRPLSVTYYESFAAAPESGKNPWLRIRKISDARPGDILSWRKDDIVRGETTGHTVIIAGIPSLDPDGRVRVRVIDSTRKIHAEDTRSEGTVGAGAGIMWFAVNEDGEPVRYYVDGGDEPGAYTKIAIGRLNPAAAPVNPTSKD